MQEQAGEKTLTGEATAALRRAVHHFRTRIATHGSYLWRYSADLTKRYGESEATATEGWVQPPGTPSVGMAYLRAHEATREPVFLDAAVETAHALTMTQLASGGWDYRIEFDPERRRRWYYRRDVEAGEREAKGRLNFTTYDDDTTQSALRFLIRVDVALNGRDREIRRAVEYGLSKLLQAQYPNGAWSQRYDGTRRNPADFPVRPARFPEKWERTHPGSGYTFWHFYTLNDNVIATLVGTLAEAFRAYRQPKYLTGIRKAGDFLILARLPEPQPVWAQQYNFQMEPAWARWFEPPAVASAESASAVQTLIDIHLLTGDERYLQPVPTALQWFDRSRLPSRLWARFYELVTNRPLYVNKKGELVYDQVDLREGYSFEGSYGIPQLFDLYRRLKQGGREKVTAERQRLARPDELAPRVRQIIEAMDAQGRWVENGFIETRTFIRHVETLADYITAVRRQRAWQLPRRLAI